MWRILAFRSISGRRPLDEWQENLEDESFIAFSVLLEHMRVSPRDLWKRPFFDVLHGEEYRGMGEIRFKGDNKRHRVYGWFGPKRLQFVLLHGCVKQRSRMRREEQTGKTRRDLVIERGEDCLYDFTLSG